MDIKSLQLKYLDLIKDRFTVEKNEEDYFIKLSVSKNLQILKDIIHFWRVNGVNDFCPVTSALLKKLGSFDMKINSYYKNNNFSNYIEEFGRSFLLYVTKDENKLISFVAEFELTMNKVKSGCDKDFFIETRYNIYEVFDFIIHDKEMPAEKEESFLIKVSSSIENNFCIVHKN